MLIFTLNFKVSYESSYWVILFNTVVKAMYFSKCSNILINVLQDHWCTWSSCAFEDLVLRRGPWHKKS